MDLLSDIPHIAATATSSVLTLSVETLVLIAAVFVLLIYFFSDKARTISFPISTIIVSFLWLIIPQSEALGKLGSSSVESFWYQFGIFTIMVFVVHIRLNKIFWQEYTDGFLKKGIEACALAVLSVGFFVIATLIIFSGDYMPISETLQPFFTSDTALASWAAAFITTILFFAS